MVFCLQRKNISQIVFVFFLIISVTNLFLPVSDAYKIHLKNDRTIEGEIEKQTDKDVVVRVLKSGRFMLSPDEIQSIEKDGKQEMDRPADLDLKFQTKSNKSEGFQANGPSAGKKISIPEVIFIESGPKKLNLRDLDTRKDVLKKTNISSSSRKQDQGSGKKASMSNHKSVHRVQRHASGYSSNLAWEWKNKEFICLAEIINFEQV